MTEALHLISSPLLSFAPSVRPCAERESADYESRANVIILHLITDAASCAVASIGRGRSVASASNSYTFLPSRIGAMWF